MATGGGEFKRGHLGYLKPRPGLAFARPWRAFLLSLCRPRGAGENSKENMERPGPVAACLEMAAAPGPGPPEFAPAQIKVQQNYPPGNAENSKNSHLQPDTTLSGWPATLYIQEKP